MTYIFAATAPVLIVLFFAIATSLLSMLVNL
jgi:hypothetical protein